MISYRYIVKSITDAFLFDAYSCLNHAHCINLLPVPVLFKIKSAYRYLPVKGLLINDRNCIHSPGLFVRLLHLAMPH
jgi:hypothetical protein